MCGLHPSHSPLRVSDFSSLHRNVHPYFRACVYRAVISRLNYFRLLDRCLFLGHTSQGITNLHTSFPLAVSRVNVIIPHCASAAARSFENDESSASIPSHYAPGHYAIESPLNFSESLSPGFAVFSAETSRPGSLQVERRKCRSVSRSTEKRESSSDFSAERVTAQLGGAISVIERIDREMTRLSLPESARGGSSFHFPMRDRPGYQSNSQCTLTLDATRRSPSIVRERLTGDRISANVAPPCQQIDI